MPRLYPLQTRHAVSHRYSYSYSYDTTATRYATHMRYGTHMRHARYTREGRRIENAQFSITNFICKMYKYCLSFDQFTSVCTNFYNSGHRLQVFVAEDVMTDSI